MTTQPVPPLMQNPIDAMEVDEPPNEQNGNNEERQLVVEEQQLVVENPSIDLEMYAQQYNGIARLYRLVYVADVCPILAVEALKMAIAYAQTTCNFNEYQFLHKRLSDLNARTAPAPTADPAAVPDMAAVPAEEDDSLAYDAVWVDTTTRKSAHKLEMLELQLRTYKSNTFKDIIRSSHVDLAAQYLSCGDLANAMKYYSRDRDYCDTGEHVVEMYLNLIKVSIYMKNWLHVITYKEKAESTPDFAKASKEAIGKIKIHTHLECAAGLAQMQQTKYKVAAQHFLNANYDHGQFPEMISANNVAVYGGLCALATFDRPELKDLVIGSTSFKPFLEVEPQLRDIIIQFHESKYASVLKQLDEIRDNYLVDMYTAPHVDTLYTQIRKRAMIQYFSPYMSADMHKMAMAFNSSVGDLENEVMQLILDGHIQARIDSQKKILYAKQADQRSSVWERALVLSKKYQRQTRMLILRAAMLKSRVVVTADSDARDQAPPRRPN
ncbi:COP9 signalosome complex subunit 1b-like [Drosophila obscura]|uniref:COP9 signalosome complex subunit 1b-like n=1 Tax=Drosophila obscura TaxID=7282 RepID=UPI001BB10F00|nr:COP9 signalosome complex subunit 1b-like [Drosophila obscura]